MPDRSIRPLLGLCLALVFIPWIAGAAAEAPDAPAANSVSVSIARAEVTKVLSGQAVAWNRGDLEAFVSAYAKDATFVTASGVIYGREQILARYRQRYPEQKGMGTLTLTTIEARPLSVDVGSGTVHGLSVVAHWKLAHPEDDKVKPAEGSTLLVLQRRGGHWEIVQDASM